MGIFLHKKKWNNKFWSVCAFERKSTAFSHPLPLALFSHAPTFPLSHTHSSSYTHTLLSHTLIRTLSHTHIVSHTHSLSHSFPLSHTHILSYFLSHTHSLSLFRTHTQNTLSHTHVHCSSRYFTSSRTISFKTVTSWCLPFSILGINGFEFFSPQRKHVVTDLNSKWKLHTTLFSLEFLRRTKRGLRFPPGGFWFWERDTRQCHHHWWETALPFPPKAKCSCLKFNIPQRKAKNLSRYPMQQKQSHFPFFLHLNLYPERLTATLSGQAELTTAEFVFVARNKKGKAKPKPKEIKQEKPWGKNGFSFRKSSWALELPSLSSRGHLLGWQAFLQPEGGGRSATQRPPVNAPQPQQVEEDGEQDHQEAAREQVVIVDKGEAPPVSVTGPEGLLLDIP